MGRQSHRPGTYFSIKEGFRARMDRREMFWEEREGREGREEEGEVRFATPPSPPPFFHCGVWRQLCGGLQRLMPCRALRVVL